MVMELRQAHSFVTIESGRLSVNRGSGSGAFPLIVRRTDASGIIAEFANSSGYGLLIGQNSATGEAYLRTGTGQDMVFTTNLRLVESLMKDSFASHQEDMLVSIKIIL